MQKPNKKGFEPGSGANVPAWLLQSGPAGAGCARCSGTNFLFRTLHRFSDVFENEFYCERSAKKPMLLQCLDARVKLLVLLTFLIFSSFASSLPVLAALAVIAVFYARLSGLAVRDYLRRVWAYVPLIVLLFSVPGASSLVTAGKPLFNVGVPGLKTGLYFSAAGLETAARLTLRSGISLSFAFLLLLTTRWSRLTDALAALRAPSTVIAILNMAYRYIFVILEMARGMMEARFVRTVGKLKTSENRRFMSRSAASLFVRSHELSGEIYDAMVCRGYAGRPAPTEKKPLAAADFLFAGSNFLILLILIAGEKIL